MSQSVKYVQHEDIQQAAMYGLQRGGVHHSHRGKILSIHHQLNTETEKRPAETLKEERNTE